MGVLVGTANRFVAEREKWRNFPRIAETSGALRICETSSPPAYYLPRAVQSNGRRAKDAAWSYPDPDAAFESIRDYIAFYPRRMDACFVGRDRVTPQPGFYYGGWVTPELVGPFKGVPGSESW